jgi:peptidoglycan L-alanyl-D-glutamate endopeptidase CwlK
MAAKSAYEAAHPGVEIDVTCTFRDVGEQLKLYACGRTAPGPIVTQCDGINHPSHHNVYPSTALDFCVVLHGKVSWEPADYEGFGKQCEWAGLIWGGAWPTFKDRPHVELPS